ncbi:SIS domain-containing protein [Candidatus Berkelbacteria bacterium]|nr:SIS domain-containing protein [Candidatus Berkelbacteria bacterium]
MGQLDDESRIRSTDSENMLQSIDDFSDQLASAYNLFEQFVLPTHFIQAREVILLGNGASVAASQMVTALARATSTVPIVLCQSDQLPAHVGTQSLVIAVSYSGQTLETVAAFGQAGQRGAKLIGISAGGEIGALCRKYRAPHFQIHYGAQARAAFGYLFIPVLGIFRRLGLIEFETSDAIEQAIEGVRAYQARLNVRVSTQQNPAKLLAESLAGRIPLFVSSELLEPIALRWKAQWHENAKSLAFVDTFPAITHTTAAGLGEPRGLRDQLIVVNLRSQADSQQESLAQNLFQQLLGKLKYECTDVVPQPSNALLQDLLMLTVLGDYTSTYVAIHAGVDPTPTPHIIEMNERLEAARAIPTY